MIVGVKFIPLNSGSFKSCRIYVINLTYHVPLENSVKLKFPINVSISSSSGHSRISLSRPLTSEQKITAIKHKIILKLNSF